MSNEKSIILHADEVRRLDAGEAVEIRREMKPQPELWQTNEGSRWAGKMPDGSHHDIENDALGRFAATCHFGAPGDQRWVREALKLRSPGGRDEAWYYAADEMTVTLPKGDQRIPAMLSWAHHKEGSTCAANHMPRWASRLSVTIVAVRCERSAGGQRWEWVLTARRVCPCEGEQVDPGPHITGCRWADPSYAEGSPL